MDFYVHEDAASRGTLAEANVLLGIDLTAEEVDAILAFLDALSDPATLDLRWTIPFRVPSGLAVAD